MQGNEHEVRFAADTDAAGRRALSRAAANDELVRVVAGVYVAAISDPAVLVRRHLWRIIGHEMPGSVITDSSILDGGTGSTGVVYVCSPTRARALELPGVRVLPRRGPGPVEGDVPLPGNVWLAGEARGLLDNLAGRRRGGQSRTLARPDVELRLEQICAQAGPERLNVVRDQARSIAPALGRESQLQVLDQLIGAVLSTRPADILQTSELRSRVAGLPVDRSMVTAFKRLAGALGDLAPAPLPALPADAERRALLPFYEAYFSNFIEGTEFTLDEAAAIVFDGELPEERPADAHDILGTYQLTSSLEAMSGVPRSGQELLAMLKDRHAVIMAGRPDKQPGCFKGRANRAGNTHFVQPEDVEGTLLHGFDVAAELLDPFARAVFMMFLISEVHPFADGNGRVSRLFMNAELVHSGHVRIVVPTVYRNNYLAGLRAASQTAGDAALIATLHFAQKWTARTDWSTRASADRDLARTHALRDPNEAEDAGVRLLLP